MKLKITFEKFNTLPCNRLHLTNLQTQAINTCVQVQILNFCLVVYTPYSNYFAKENSAAFSEQEHNSRRISLTNFQSYAEKALKQILWLLMTDISFYQLVLLLQYLKTDIPHHSFSKFFITRFTSFVFQLFFHPEAHEKTLKRALLILPKFFVKFFSKSQSLFHQLFFSWLQKPSACSFFLLLRFFVFTGN